MTHRQRLAERENLACLMKHVTTKMVGLDSLNRQSCITGMEHCETHWHKHTNKP
jgi:hypothetical protein